MDRTTVWLLTILFASLLSPWFMAAAGAAPPQPTNASPAILGEGELHEASAMRRFERRVNAIAAGFNRGLGAVLFYDVGGIPLAVLWLMVAATFLTFKMRFINVRAFRHALLVTAGKYDVPGEAGEVSHFQALAAALSATVGMGNIAGVAVAIGTGGPGATVWIIVAGLLGMTSKMTECTLGLQYRQIRPDGRLMGGAMFYLSRGLAEIGLGRLGKVLATLFALLCIGGSFAGGNAFQVNQSLEAVKQTLPILNGHEWVYGLVMTALTGVVIIGGIRRIATTADKIVPAMCALYVLACLYILAVNYQRIPAAAAAIVSGALTPSAGLGGALGVLVIGFRRGAFSNEAGVGSAAIAHAAAKTPYPVREGIVALLEPFIDTVVVCTMTALAIVITGVYDATDPEFAPLIKGGNGAALTSRAFGQAVWWFPHVLSLAVFLFAYSTQISWSYYGERCWAYLFGDRATMSYRVIFLAFTFLGSVMSATEVLEFGDLMILGMAFPNLIGVLLLSGKVKRELDEYWARYRAGDFDRKDVPHGERTA
jgi:alanine or glycine:cation symporter, AGCS family